MTCKKTTIILITFSVIALISSCGTQSLPDYIPEPTTVPTPEASLHPDLETHYISRDKLSGTENMSEYEIQYILDMYDMGYEAGYDDGMEQGYEYGYEDKEIEDERDDYRDRDDDHWVFGY